MDNSDQEDPASQGPDQPAVPGGHDQVLTSDLHPLPESGEVGHGTDPPPEPKGVTWGDLQTLSSRAGEVTKDVGTQDTPGYLFLAYLSVVSSNSVRTMLIRVLFACLGGLGLPAGTQHTSWGHILDPPIFKLYTLWNSEPPLSSNDNKWTGGVWLPPNGPLEEKQHWLSIPENTMCQNIYLLVLPPYLTLCNF